jgi:hypothetical protein
MEVNMLVEKELCIGGRFVKKLIHVPDPPVPQDEQWIDGSTLVGLEHVWIIPPWHTTWAIPLACVEYERNPELATRLGLTEEQSWRHEGRQLIILHHGCSDPPTRLVDGRAAPRGHCFYDATVATKLTLVMSEWVSKEVERSAQRQRIKQRLDAEAADLARQFMDRERNRAQIEKQQLENTPESRMRKLEEQMKALLEENKRLKNGHGDHEKPIT